MRTEQNWIIVCRLAAFKKGIQRYLQLNTDAILDEKFTFLVSLLPPAQYMKPRSPSGLKT